MKLQNNQNGFLILGDVHGIYSPFNKAVEYAQQHDLTLIAVGDLVDNGYEGEPIVSDMLKLLENQKAYAIWGNHEWKVRRWLADNSTPVGWPSKITINQFKESAEFENNFIDIVAKEIKKGKLRGNINDVVVDLTTEFYYYLWSNKNQWQSTLRNKK